MPSLSYPSIVLCLAENRAFLYIEASEGFMGLNLHKVMHLVPSPSIFALHITYFLILSHSQRPLSLLLSNEIRFF